MKEQEKLINKSMSKMEEMIKRSIRLDDLIDYHSLSLFPDVRLPPKFKMPTLDKFDGTSCPKSQLKMYMKAKKLLGATKEMLAQMFHTFTEAAFRWVLSIDVPKLKIGRTYVESSIIKIKYNIEWT